MSITHAEHDLLRALRGVVAMLKDEAEPASRRARNAATVADEAVKAWGFLDDPTLADTDRDRQVLTILAERQHTLGF